jgi:hypothetical protein
MQAVELKEDRHAARDKYAEYLQAVRENPAEMDYKILRDAYRELSRGKCVIDLPETLRLGGLDIHQRPRLAVSRAHAKWCHFFYRDPWNHAPQAIFSPWRKYDTGSRRIGLRFRPTLFGLDRAARQKFPECKAIVPSIPPSLKPAANRLAEYFILFEAVWEPMPPVDPMLLKPISKNLYVVVAQWDLTPFERSVLAESTFQ